MISIEIYLRFDETVWNLQILIILDQKRLKNSWFQSRTVQFHEIFQKLKLFEHLVWSIIFKDVKRKRTRSHKRLQIDSDHIWTDNKTRSIWVHKWPITDFKLLFLSNAWISSSGLKLKGLKQKKWVNSQRRNNFKYGQ